MTETTTVDEEDAGQADEAGDEAGDDEAGDVAASDGGDGTDEPLELAGGIAPEGPIKDRLLLPLLLPWLCIAAVALYALNVSRIFLAGDSTSALIIGTIITVAILAGATIISASPRLRTSSLAMIMGFVLDHHRVGWPALARAEPQRQRRRGGVRVRQAEGAADEHGGGHRRSRSRRSTGWTSRGTTRPRPASSRSTTAGSRVTTSCSPTRSSPASSSRLPGRRRATSS